MASSEVNDTNRWECRKCTFLNSIAAYPKCMLCDHSDCSLTNTSTNKNTTTNLISLTVRDRRSYDVIKAEKLFRKIISYCHKNKIDFVDDQFPPTSRSIGNDNSSLEWLRISEIDLPLSSRRNHQIQWTVYSSPEPNDIQQGELGDCWLMAALALITERPKMLEYILLTKTINKEGIYLVRLCHNGIWRTVILDDCFPCTKYQQLAYTKANRYQMYVPLIEKACAKLFGSYAKLIGGQTEEGLQLLTGAPCDYIDLNPDDPLLDTDIIWAKLLSSCEYHLLIGAATARTDISESAYERINIKRNHAYSILAACNLSHISMQFILVRDPHGQSNYEEELATTSILNELNSLFPSRLPSGAFWISWPSFLQYFSSITISTYSSDYYDIRELGKFTRLSSESIPTFHFYLPKTSLVNISLIYHRQDRRLRAFHTQSFLLCRIKDEQSRNIDHTDFLILQTYRGELTYWSGLLKSGFYILIPFSVSFWDEKYSKMKRNYTLVIHSKVQINGEFIREPPTVLTDHLIAYCVKEYPRMSKNRYFSYYVTNGKFDLMIFVAENSSLTSYLNLDIDMSDGIFIRNSRQSLITHDCIPPRHRQIIFLTEWTHEETHQIGQMGYVYQYSHVQDENNPLPTINYIRNDFHSCRSY